eukprot:13078609-Alexandrium_andersonii.AAC.1
MRPPDCALVQAGSNPFSHHASRNTVRATHGCGQQHAMMSHGTHLTVRAATHADARLMAMPCYSRACVARTHICLYSASTAILLRTDLHAR